MKKLLYILLLIPIISLCQSYEFVYSYTYKYDSLHPNNIIEEDIFVLRNDIDRYYVSKNTYNINEIEYLANLNNENPQTTWSKLGQIPNSKLTTIIYEKASNTMILNSKLGTINYETELSFRDIIWNLKDEKHKNNIELKKAITTYLGRQWIAWYNDNIPINDGPFIFKNLPGLIVELYDVENNYNWTLSQYKYDVNNQNKEILAKRIKKAIKLSNKEFNNIINQDFMDPTISIESAGIQVSEDKKTKIREFLKNQKYRFIIKDLMLYL